jgi:16S rRNA (guanine527-N7)-methyltransferase
MRSAPREWSVPRRSPVHGAAPATAFDRDALRARLLAGLAELGLDAVPVERLLDYLALLAKWSGVYNLTAIREPLAMLHQHLFDSLSIVGPLAARLPAPAGPRWRVIDVGSGAGLPGIVLALLWPQAEVLLVEPVGKKAAFLRQCKTELALANISVTAARIQSLPATGANTWPDLIVCRAFASLAGFIAAIERIAGPDTLLAAMKGALPENELAALPPGWSAVEVLPLHPPELAASRHLILLRRLVPACSKRLNESNH